MQLGMIGLGRMGGNMAARLIQRGHEVVVWNRHPEAIRRAESRGAKASPSLAELPRMLKAPRAVWLMIPQGPPVDETLAALLPGLAEGDVVVDGGNSRYQDSSRRAKELAARGVHFMDQGTSGGIWGHEAGYCCMVGGSPEGFRAIEPALKDLAPKDGYLHCGPSGSGHFAKMVHNGIEYGMLQALGEGFHLMKASEFELDLHAIAKLWNRGSVVRSWLLELAERALASDPRLDEVPAYVEDSGEGRWTVLEAVEKGVAAPVLTQSLFARFRSRDEANFSDKLIAALRREFGGHAVQGGTTLDAPPKP